MFKARVQDAFEIWQPDKGQYPQGSAIAGWLGFLLRVKCSICIMFGWEGDGYDYVPVYIGPMSVWCNEANWTEVGVKYGWREWSYLRYRNGV